VVFDAGVVDADEVHGGSVAGSEGVVGNEESLDRRDADSALDVVGVDGGVIWARADVDECVVRNGDVARDAADAVALLLAFDFLADLNDIPAKFMPEHHGIIHQPGVIGGPWVKIGIANTDIDDFEEYILRTDGGLFDLTNFDGALFRCKVDDGGRFHGGGRHHTLRQQMSTKTKSV
jgi:hypothetical protein